MTIAAMMKAIRTKKTLAVGSGIVLLFLFCFILGGVSKAQEEISDKEKSKILHDIVDTYIREVRKWEPGTYKTRGMGKRGPYYVVIGCLLQDVEDAKNYMEQHPGRGISGHYPSEFMIMIDFEKREVVEDIRPGQKERNPRP